MRRRVIKVFLGREVYLLRRDCRANHFGEQELDDSWGGPTVKRLKQCWIQEAGGSRVYVDDSP